MADIEMDLDINGALGQNALGDDDVIEYDTDIPVANPDESEWMIEDVEIQENAQNVAESDMDAHIEMGDHEALGAGTPVDVMEVLESIQAVPKSDADMVSELGADDIVQADHQSPHRSAGELGAFSDALSAAPETTMNEVDHQSGLSDSGRNNEAEAQDHDEEGDEALELDLAPEHTPLPVPESFDVTEEDRIAISLAEKPLDQSKMVASDPTEHNIQVLEDELTWEEEEDDDHDGLSSDKNAETGEAEAVTIHREEHAVAEENVSAETGQPVNMVETDAAGEKPETTYGDPVAEIDADNAHQSDFAETGVSEGPLLENPTAAVTQDGGHESRAANIEEAGTETSEAAPREPTLHPGDAHAQSPETGRDAGSTSMENQSYPSITIQYKGDEFPCFAAEDGFFTNLDLVDEPMENLLSGFRSELSEELDANEELIFHVDELGLEFAEVFTTIPLERCQIITNCRDQSTQHDILAGTTLRYILDIHAMLVQNQDQSGSSRTLYAYLFTRPSTSKRLDFLAESAAHGRGLDEVIHLFEPGMILQQASHDDSDSGAEITHIELEHDAGSEVAPSVAGHRDAPDDADGGFETNAAEQESRHDDGIDVSEHEAHDPMPSTMDGEFGNAESIEVGDQSVAATTFIPALTSDNPDEEAGLVQEDHDFQSGIATAEEEDEALLTNVTSASSTLNGNEQSSVRDEETANTRDVEELAEEVNFHGDDLAEIDWKDEEDEDEGPTLAVEQNTPSKRARTDDELDSVEQTGTFPT